MGVGTAIGIGGIAAAGIGAVGSNAAANTQAGAANNAANLQASDASQLLAEQQREFNINQANQAPFLATGQDAAKQLEAGLQPGGSLVAPWTQPFTAPTAATEQNDPGYAFRLQQGQQALENSASARGGLLSGNTAVAEQQYGQDYASNEYSNVYNRSLQQYQQQYNIFQNNQANTFNRLSAAAGGGQTAANELGSTGQAAATNIANINSTSGQQIGNSINNAAYQRASGYVGASNALTGGLNNITGNFLLQQQVAQQAAMVNNPYGPGGIDPTSMPTTFGLPGGE